MKTTLTLIAAMLIITASISAAVDTNTKHDRKEVTIIIGELVDVPENKTYFDNTGTIFVIPYDFESGIQTIAVNGFICEIYGHNYDGGICKLCGTKEH